MALGITDTVSSIALVMVPPGNVMRAIAEIRRAFWTQLGAPSARAYFDVPVLAWLADPLDGATLAGLASRSTLPFELIGFERQSDDIFLRFPVENSAKVLELTSKTPQATDTSNFSPGPFEAGLGCFCASLAGILDSKMPIVDQMAISPIRVKTYILAQLEFRWIPGPTLASSWATLSSARAGRIIR